MGGEFRVRAWEATVLCLSREQTRAFALGYLGGEGGLAWVKEEAAGMDR